MEYGKRQGGRFLVLRRGGRAQVNPAACDWCSDLGRSEVNLVERFFADLTKDVIRTGSFASAGELVSDINTYLAGRYFRAIGSSGH